MIKVNNPKPLSEIEELREKGLYNAPYSVLESVDFSQLKTQEFDDSEIRQRLDEIEFNNAEFGVTIYEELSRIEESNTEAILSLYEQLLGGM